MLMSFILKEPILIAETGTGNNLSSSPLPWSEGFTFGENHKKPSAPNVSCQHVKVIQL